ncbi:MAG: hypothetical protein Q7U16_04755 [Agitococcus sp.]|nr:hypothetical protein [Agitococcus sp.]
MTITTVVTEILAGTNDGNGLTPLHLALTQLAINGPLSEEGECALYALHQEVISGEYAGHPHWFHGITHLTQDHEGYVYWRGKHVEHYSYHDDAAEKIAALQLAADCLALEAKNFPVNGRTAISDACREAPADTPWKKAIQTYYSFFEQEGVVTGIFYRKQPADASPVSSVPFNPVISLVSVNGNVEITEHEGAYEAFHALQNKGMASMGCLVTYAELEARLTRMAVPADVLDLALEGY